MFGATVFGDGENRSSLVLSWVFAQGFFLVWKFFRLTFCLLHSLALVFIPVDPDFEILKIENRHRIGSLADLPFLLLAWHVRRIGMECLVSWWFGLVGRLDWPGWIGILFS